ncbi:MAG TPA: hypothetical protein VIA62_27155 [Thermoanaerobaculia bacterium]|nr:hypothetical protein [Thermoanaerobaculia bacterium]
MSSLSPAQRRAIDQAKEKLVVAAEQLLTDAGVAPSKDFGHSQLRNLVAVATETESPAVVLNFIRYQMGRDDRQKNWAQGGEGQRLGERFIVALNNDDGVVAKALTDIPGLAGNPLALQLARMQLIRYFLGFATRYMKYLELQAGQARRGGGR